MILKNLALIFFKLMLKQRKVPKLFHFELSEKIFNVNILKFALHYNPKKTLSSFTR